MTLKNIIAALGRPGLASAFVAAAMAAETAKPSAEVEANVTQAIRKAFPDAAITSLTPGTEDGLDVIGVALTSGGAKIDADVTPEGMLVGTEQPADIATFPEAAAKTLRKVTKGVKASFEIAKTFAKAEKDAAGKMHAVALPSPTVAYEADVEKDGKKGEFAVDTNGAILESPKWARAGGGKSKETEDEEDKD